MLESSHARHLVTQAIAPFALGLAWLPAVPTAARAQPVYEVVAAFGARGDLGLYPAAELLQGSDGSLYGTTVTVEPSDTGPSSSGMPRARWSRFMRSTRTMERSRTPGSSRRQMGASTARPWMESHCAVSQEPAWTCADPVK